MIYLDSAVIEEVRQVSQWKWVKGITTNPTILAKSGLSPEETLQKIAELTSGQVYYQVTASDPLDMVKEAYQAAEIIGHQTVIKVPATPNGLQTCAKLFPKLPCTVTAVYSPSQALIAKEAGAYSVAVYVNRATRLLGDGLKLVSDIAAILQGSNTKILAASLKSPEEAVNALKAGANQLTLPFSVLSAMVSHPLSEETVREFEELGTGLSKHTETLSER